MHFIFTHLYALLLLVIFLVLSVMLLSKWREEKLIGEVDLFLSPLKEDALLRPKKIQLEKLQPVNLNLNSGNLNPENLKLGSLNLGSLNRATLNNTTLHQEILSQHAVQSTPAISPDKSLRAVGSEPIEFKPAESKPKVSVATLVKPVAPEVDASRQIKYGLLSESQTLDAEFEALLKNMEERASHRKK